jgi:hypothetical protein
MTTLYFVVEEIKESTERESPKEYPEPGEYPEIPQRAPANPEDDGQAENQDQIVGRISTRQATVQNVPPPQAAPKAPDIVTVFENQGIVPTEAPGEPIGPPLEAPSSAIFQSAENDTAEEEGADNEKAEPSSPPSQTTANPQTSDSEKFVLMILSFVGFLFSIMLFSIVRQKCK